MARRARRRLRVRNFVGMVLLFGISGGAVWAWFRLDLEDVGRKVDSSLVIVAPSIGG